MNTSSTARSLLLSLTAALALGGCDQGSDDEQFDGNNFRIVGGAPVSSDPAVALLLMFDGNGQIASTCTGTLIDSQWVLTAAHCLSPAGIAGVGVYFGADAVSMSDPYQIAYVEADQAAIHPQWVDGGAPDQGNDVALLHLSQAAPVEPIAINRTPLTEQMLGADVYLVGWGITGGGQGDSGIKRAVMSALYDFDASFMVVGDAATGTCSGDSGGPAFMMMNNQIVVAGVTSYGDTNCQQISVDMRVDAFASWIDQTMGVTTPTGPTIPPTGPSAGGIGDQCASGDDCQTGLCVGDGTSGFCTAQCSSDADCGDGWACFGTNDPSLKVCAPDDGVTDSGEAGDDGNSDPTFPMTGGNTTDSDGDEGGEDGTDEGGGGGGGYEDDDDDSKGGCTVGSKAPSSLALMMVVLGGLVRRRRAA